MRSGAVGLHGIGILSSIPLAENRGVHGERFVCRWGSCIQLHVGPCVEQLGPQGLALLLLHSQGHRGQGQDNGFLV